VATDFDLTRRGVVRDGAERDKIVAIATRDRIADIGGRIRNDPKGFTGSQLIDCDTLFGCRELPSTITADDSRREWLGYSRGW
jgi:hypothetical protein